MDKTVKTVGHVVMAANPLLIAAIVIQVALRYALNLNFPKFDEMQWRLYGLVTMVGVSYALTTNSHVRVDLLHMQLSRRAQRVVEAIGISCLLFPLIFLMIDQGCDYCYESWRVNETSSSATGLPMRWAFKAIIPLSVVMLAVAALARLIHDLHALVTPAEGEGVWLVLLALAAFALLGWGLSQFVETTEEILIISVFLSFIGLLFTGFPVAWALAGVGMIFRAVAYYFDAGTMAWTGLEDTFTGLDYLTLGAVVNRVYTTMSNAVLVAPPLFIFMGLMLDESGVAERLMTAMTHLFGSVRGGLAITVTRIGIILAASTGIVGASVVLLGVLSLPAMAAHRYANTLATGVCAASGTLGILIPPSIMLVIMADQMALSVGDLFMAAAIPGTLLGVLYLGYIFLVALVSPNAARARDGARVSDWDAVKNVFVAAAPPPGLILAVLGSIVAGVCTPTEASGIGALGATLLAVAYRKLTLANIWNVLKATFNTTADIFAIFLGAAVFSFVLREGAGASRAEAVLFSNRSPSSCANSDRLGGCDLAVGDPDVDRCLFALRPKGAGVEATVAVCFQPADAGFADAGLADAGLAEGAAAIAMAVPPGHAAMPGDLRCVSFPLSPAMGPAMGPAGGADRLRLRRDHDLRRRFHWPRRPDRRVDRRAVIGAVREHGADPAA